MNTSNITNIKEELVKIYSLKSNAKRAADKLNKQTTEGGLNHKVEYIADQITGSPDWAVYKITTLEPVNNLQGGKTSVTIPSELTTNNKEETDMSDENNQVIDTDAEKAAKAAEKAAKAEAAKIAKEAEKAEKAAKREADKAAKAAEKEAAKAAKEAARIVQNGIRRPGAEGLCGKAWALFDTLSAEAKRPVSLGESIRAAEAHNSGTAVFEPAMEIQFNITNIKCEYQAWKTFNGLKGQAIVDPIKDAEKAAKEIERQAKAQAAKEAKAAERAAKKAEEDAKKAAEKAAKAAAKQAEAVTE